MDEVGLALGITNNHRVIGTSRTTKAICKTPGNREWVTIIECMSATGGKLRPLVIFKGKTLQSTWFPARIPDFRYATSANGWTSNLLALEWLQQIFLPSTAPLDGEPRLLLLDNHGSHITTDFMLQCYRNNVYLYYLIPHMSHVCQPLDVGPFSSVKAKYRGLINTNTHTDNAAPVKKQSFITHIYTAREQGMSRTNIQGGWEGTGIVPWCPRKIR